MLEKIYPQSPDKYIVQLGGNKAQAAVARMAHLNKIVDAINNLGKDSLTRYVNPEAPEGGNESFAFPFNTMAETLASIPNDGRSYTIYVGQGEYNEAPVTLPNISNVNFIGDPANNTVFNFTINYTPLLGATVNQFNSKIAFNGSYNLDASLVAGGGVQFLQSGLNNFNRIDTNPNVVLAIFQTGVSGASIKARAVFNDCILIGDITVAPGSEAYFISMLGINPTSKIFCTGNCIVKSLSMLNPEIYLPAGLFDGTVDGSGTPTWLTDAASDGPFTGAMIKTVY